MPAETMKRSSELPTRSPRFGQSKETDFSFPEPSTNLKQSPVGNFTTPSNYFMDNFETYLLPGFSALSSGDLKTQKASPVKQNFFGG